MRRVPLAHLFVLGVAMAARVALAADATAAPDTIRLDGRDYAVLGACPQPAYSVRLSLAPLPGQDRMHGLSVLFGADSEGRGYRFDADTRGWQLLSLGAAAPRVVARGAASFLPKAGPTVVLIKRRDWLLTVAVDGRVLAEAADADHFGGFVAVDPALSAPGGEPSLQTVSRLRFEDAFTRPDNDLTLTPWAAESGHWRLHSVREDVDDVDLRGTPEDRQPQSSLSANPFCLSGSAEDWGLLTAGYWFWDDFEATASLRGPGAKAAGLAFNISSPQDFFLLRWENRADTVGPTCIQLLRVRGTERQELARAWVNGQKDQWYALGVRTCGRRIQALLDQAVIMDLRHDECLGGKVGLYVEGADGDHEASFDDVLVRSISGYDCDDELWLRTYVASREGQWEVWRVDRPGRPANYAAVLRSASGRMVIGQAAWPASLLSARLSAPAAGCEVGFELALGSRTSAPCRVTLARDGNGPRLSLSRSGLQGEEELASCSDFSLPESGSVELAADLTRPGELNVYIEDKLRLHVARTEAGDGAVGLFGRPSAGPQGKSGRPVAAGTAARIEFRDVRVAFERDEDVERPPAKEVFRDDPFMKHWSSPQGAWWPVEGRQDAWWHVGDFYGRSEVEMPLDPRVLFVHAATAVSPEAGYALVQEKVRVPHEGRERDGIRLRLLRQGQEVAGATVVPAGADPPKLILCKETPYLWVTVDGQEALAFRDADPLPGTRAALSGLKAEELARLRLRRFQVRDYYFEEAPADWYHVGKWKVTTRFDCDRRWSHMAAIATQNAVLFNKFRYGGDVTLEAYMGTRMGAAPAGGRYARIGDFNLALCRSPFDLAQGYNFVVAGWDRFWSDCNTFLLKDGRQLTGTAQRLLPNVRREDTQTRVLPVPWVSGGRDVHGAWYYIKARKQGGELVSFVENHPAYSWTDPEPIKEFTPAVWTYNTEVVVARVKISYQRKAIPGRLVDPPVPEPEPRLPAVPAPAIVSGSHPGFCDDFEGGEMGWRTYPGQQSSVLRIARPGAGMRGHSLHVLNPGTGGLLEAIAPLAKAGIRPADARLLSFDYRIPPDVKVNLFFKVGEHYCFAHMTGPDEGDAFYRPLGELPVQADGKWHQAQFPLAAAYRQAGGDPKALLESAVFGNLHRGLLQAGIGGNGSGTWYQIDNFRIASVGPADFRAAAPTDLSQGNRLLAAVDALPATIPGEEKPLEQTSLAPGPWVCHARVAGPDGRESAVAHLPFLVATEPLEVTSCEPAPAANWDYGPITVQFSGSNAPFLDLGSLRLALNGVPVSAAPGLFEMDWLSNRLRVDLQHSGVGIAAGGQCRLDLNYADQFGRAGSFHADCLPVLAQDRVSPSAVVIEGYMPTCDFESGLGTWESSRNVTLLRDDTTAATGKWSLKVQNLRWEGEFMAWPLRAAFSAGAYPIAEFDYKAHDAVLFDMVCAGTGGYATVGLSDRSHYSHYVGEAPGFQADDAWHHAEVDLLACLKKLPYVQGVFRQQWLGLGDFGYRANAIGAYYHVDNFRFVPLVSGMQDLTLRWHATDASGISGYSYAWSASPEGSPDDVIDTAENGGTFRDLPVPDAYLHIKACDAAGNWGPVSSFRFRVDSSLPEVAEATPAQGARSAASRLSVAVKDAGSAVDPDTLVLTVQGQPYAPHSQGVAYDLQTGQLVWDWVQCRPESQRSIPDGATVAMAVSARDFAGNAAPEVAWHWVMDYSLDRDPPTAPVLGSATMPLKALEDFQSGVGQWRNARGNDWGAQLKQVWRDEEHGDYCLEVFAPVENSFFDAAAFSREYDLGAYPLVCFDYLMPEPVKVNMQVLINKLWFEVKMTAPNCAYTVLGDAPAPVADNAWHHVTLDLLQLAKKALPQAQTYTVSAVSFGDPARNGNRKNARWFVDNFMICGYGAPDAEMQWRSEDITGVDGYSVAFDREMATEPPRQVSTTAESGRFTAGEPGTYWLHVAAYDGNGNWSQPRHLTYVVAPRPEAAPPEQAAGP